MSKPQPFETTPEAMEVFQRLIDQACVLSGEYIKMSLIDRVEDALQYQLIVVPVAWSLLSIDTHREIMDKLNNYWCCLRYPAKVAAISEVSSRQKASQSHPTAEVDDEIRNLSLNSKSKALLIPGMLHQLQGLARILRLKPSANYTAPGKRAMVLHVHKAVLQAISQVKPFDPFEL
jgi:hypothetical protein